MKSALGVFLLLATTIAASAQSQPPPPSAAPQPDYPVIRVGVLSYLQYAAELENRDAFNGFDVTRAYLNINAQVAKNLRFRFTPDIRRVTDGALSGSLLVRVKYAFAQFDDPTPRGWIRLGVHQTPWLDFEESINRYRVQGQMFAERDGLIPGSGDFGVSYFTPLPGNFGELHGGVFNGEGFGQAETNKYKSVQGRLTIRPLATRGIWNGLRVTGFYNAGWYAAKRPRRLGIAMASFEHSHLVITAEALKATERPLPSTITDIERTGESYFVEVRQGLQGWAGLARVDRFDPDDAIATNAQRRIIAGGAYWFVWPRARLGLVATDEHVAYVAPTRPDEHRVLFQTHVEF